MLHAALPWMCSLGESWLCELHRVTCPCGRAVMALPSRQPHTMCVSCPLYNASTSYYHDTPSSLGGEEETGGGDTVATNPGQAEQVVDAEPQTDRIHRKQRLGAHTCNICTAPDTWHLAVFKAFRSELLTSPY